MELLIYFSLIHDFDGDNRIDNNDSLYSKYLSTSDEEEIFSTLGAGTYFVRMERSSSNVNTNYNLSLSATANPSAPIFDPGNTLATARDLGSLGSQQNIKQFVGSVDSDDYYQFTLSETSDVRLFADGANQSGIYFSLIHDFDGDNRIDNNDSLYSKYLSTSDEEEIFSTLGAGTYFVRMERSSSNVNTNYNLSLSATANPSAPIFDPGNTLATARDLGSLGSQQNIKQFVGSVDSDDYYQFTLSETSDVRLFADGVNQSGIYFDLIHDFDGDNQIDSGDRLYDRYLGASREAEIISTLGAGTYFVRMRRNSSNVNTNYNLSLSATSNATGEADPRTINLTTDKPGEEEEGHNNCSVSANICEFLTYIVGEERLESTEKRLLEDGKVGPYNFSFSLGSDLKLKNVGDVVSVKEISYLISKDSNKLFSLEGSGLQLTYLDNSDELLVQGKLSGSAPFLNKIPLLGKITGGEPGLTLDLTNSAKQNKYLKVSDEGLDIVGELVLDNVLYFGNAFGLRQAKFFLDTEVNEWKGEAKLSIPSFRFPEIEVGIGYIQNPANNNKWEFNSFIGGVDNLNYPIPGIYALFLQKAKIGVDNWSEADSDSTGLLGEFGFTGGGEIDIKLPDWAINSGYGAYEASLLKIDIDGEISASKVSGAAKFTLIDEKIMYAEGNLDLNIINDSLKGDLEFSILNGLVKGNGQLTVNSNLDITAYGTGSVQLPTINLFETFGFGGITLREGSVLVKYTNNGDRSDDFVAAWGLDKLSPFNWISKNQNKEIGFQLNLDGSWNILGAGEIESVKKLIPGESSFDLNSQSTSFNANTTDMKELVKEALIISQSYLSQFVINTNSDNVLNAAFGDRWNKNTAKDIIKSWLQGNFDNLPEISLIDSSSIENANAAFADSTNTIYIAEEYLAYHQNSPEAVAEVITEEIGHWIDAQINSVDSAGDEGAIFSKLVGGEILTEDRLLALQTEDDIVSISLDGVVTEVNLNSFVENSFSVAEGTPWLALAANWENENDNVAIELLAPNGNVYSESDIANNENIAIVEELTDSTHKIINIQNPDAGNWTIRLVDNNGLGNVEFAALGGTDEGSININSLTHNTSDNTVTINYDASNIKSDANISFFYDTDDANYDGLLISESVIQNDSIGSFTWNTEGIATGEYYIYAMVMDENSAPSFDYSEQSITISQQADISVTQVANFEPVGVGEELTYTVDVTNNGDISSKGITLDQTFSSSVIFKSSSIDPVKQEDNIISFDLGDLEAGESKQIEITVTAPDTVGDIDSQSTVTSQTFDPDIVNDTAILSTTVADESIPVKGTEDRPTLDIDGNGLLEPQDYTLINLYASLGSNAGIFDIFLEQYSDVLLGEGATRNTGTEITEYLASSQDQLFDLDSNNIVESSDYSFLDLYSAFGANSQVLDIFLQQYSDVLLGEGATRTSATEIMNYIQQNLPSTADEFT